METPVTGHGIVRGMEKPTDDDLFLDAAEVMVLNVLDRIGGDPKAQFEFFRRSLAVAKAVAGQRERG